VVCGFVAKRVLLAVEGKEALTRGSFAEHWLSKMGIPRRSRQIAHVIMSPAIGREVRENFGNAQIVFDKSSCGQPGGPGGWKKCDGKKRAKTPNARQLERTSLVVAQNPERWTAGEERALEH